MKTNQNLSHPKYYSNSNRISQDFKQSYLKSLQLILDDEKFNEKVDAYLEHTQNVKPGKNENNETRVRRIRLANAVKQTLADMKKDDTKITNEINNKTSALVPNAVEHYKENIEVELIENEVQKDLNKSFALEKNLDDSLDESLENDPNI